MIDIGISLVTSFMIGFLFLLTLWQCQKPLQCHLLVKSTLGIAAGFGISSFIFFTLLLLMGHVVRQLVILTDIFLLFTAYGLFVRYSKRMNRKSTICNATLPTTSRSKNITDLLFIGGFVIALYLAILSFTSFTLLLPHGQWDAWAIWNLHARFLFAGGEYWTNVFSRSISWTHSDYPWFLPSLVARSWTYSGNSTILVPIVLAMIFTFAGVGMLYAGLSILRNIKQALLACIVLLSTPFYIEQGSSQYADTALGFYMLSSIILWYLYNKNEKRDTALIALSGITTGLAAFTKNEGILFLVVYMIVFFFLGKNIQGIKQQLKAYKIFFLACIPFVLVTVFVKMYYAPPNYLLSEGLGQDFSAKIMNTQRYRAVWNAFITEGSTFGKFSVPMPLILLFYGLVQGIRVPKKEYAILLKVLFFIILILAGYFMTYIISPYSLEWHLQSSLHRLFIQLWPSVLFMIFLIIRHPE